MANISQIKLPDNTVYDIKDSNAGPRPILHFEHGDSRKSPRDSSIFLIHKEELPAEQLQDGQIIFVIMTSAGFGDSLTVHIAVSENPDDDLIYPLYTGTNSISRSNPDNVTNGAAFLKGVSFILIYFYNSFHVFGLPIAV